MTSAPHILFAGSGPGGHIHPGLAVAAHLAARLPEARITFVGAGKASERHTVRSAGYCYANLPSQPPPRTPLEAVRFVTDNVAGYWAARWLLKEQDVSLVVGLASHSGAATLRAATARGIPSVLIEQNAVPGRLARWLARSASAVCAGFEHARPCFPLQVPLVITGNPARPAFERLHRRMEDDDDNAAARDQRTTGPVVAGLMTEPHSAGSGDPRTAGGDHRTAPDTRREKRLLVIGGAGGAHSLNQFMPGALRQLGERLTGWRVVHQTGEGQLQETEARYCRAEVEALVVSYIDEMAPVLFDSDLVVCRAGGTTLAELALAGVPALLVPYSLAADAYQMANAQIVAAAGAATIIDEASLAGRLDHVLAAHLSRLVEDDPRRAEMAVNMRRLANPDAASRITDVVCDVLAGNLARLAA
jgi:UDP-N-acetylglucosamine--N-acetylmuramyl-(pentapeptide) pyrophosphoryl-undecaprenol N-acetylglucosamine transferase